MTSTDVALRQSTPGALAVAPNQQGWTDKQIAALRAIGAEAANDGELELFLHVCQRTGLDPFARQIYLVNYGSSEPGKAKMTIQTGIDGYRLIARRAVAETGESLEIGAPEWCGPTGQWQDVWLADDPPGAARVTVKRAGYAFPAVAIYRELVATKAEVEWVNGKPKRTGRRVPNDRWAKAPASQLAKCAEALALRRAFPHDLAGMHTEDELEHLSSPATVVAEQDSPAATAGGLAQALAQVESATTVAELRAVWARWRQTSLTLGDRARFEAAAKERARQLDPDPPEEPQDDGLLDAVKNALRRNEHEHPEDVGEEVASTADMAEITHAMDQLGYQFPGDQLRLASRMIGQQLAALGQITPTQASDLLTRLQDCLRAPDPQGAIDVELLPIGGSRHE